MFLRDHGFERGRLTLRDHRSHKLDAIEQLMLAFPAQKFLLIGDSGQKDPRFTARWRNAMRIASLG